MKVEQQDLQASSYESAIFILLLDNLRKPKIRLSRETTVTVGMTALYPI